MLYLCSPYYRIDIYSGANKRFEALLHEWQLANVEFTIIVKEGHKPEQIHSDNCIFIPNTICKDRFLTFLWLSTKLMLVPKGILISDFNPIPVPGYLKHDSYLLIHDLRRLIDDEGVLKNNTARVYSILLRLFPKVITVSKQSKKLLVNHLKLPANKIIVSYNGVSDEYTNDFELHHREIDILYIAHFEERKRHIDLLKALILFDYSRLHIIFVGVDNGYYREIEPWIKKAQKVGHKIEVLSNLSESELIQLYRNSKIYAFPSELEGFGMPLIEAQSQGCKVLCSNLDVFKEIGNNRNYYFKSKNVQSLLKSLTYVVKDNSEHQRFVDQRFLWKNIAGSLLKDIKEKNNT